MSLWHSQDTDPLSARVLVAYCKGEFRTWRRMGQVLSASEQAARWQRAAPNAGWGGQDRLGQGIWEGWGTRELSRTGGLRAASRGGRLLGSLSLGTQKQSALPATGPPFVSPPNVAACLKGHLWSGEPVMQAQPRETWALQLLTGAPWEGRGRCGGALPAEGHQGPGACAEGLRTPRDTVCPQYGP